MGRKEPNLNLKDRAWRHLKLMGLPSISRGEEAKLEEPAQFMSQCHPDPLFLAKAAFGVFEIEWQYQARVWDQDANASGHCSGADELQPP